MKIHFRAKLKATLTEYWSIEAPPDWDQLSETECLAWLNRNFLNAEYRSQDAPDEERRVAIDYHTPS